MGGVDVKIGAISVPLSLLVMDDVPFPMIIWMPTLEVLGARIDNVARLVTPSLPGGSIRATAL